ncbi:unnamed protein product [Ceutorhynchus assimilis]|uniref:Uncharacterized protein n=1 Tax=Ceutorhynchus assimilis TaxID=467358 RepID=A0A9N9M9P5_9CUCU|nr:unnamed protein product [Ceutorhynchus assimilis]
MNYWLLSIWMELIKNGLPEDALLELGKKYPFPENCSSLQAPKLNPELKAAINDSGKKRDDRLWNIQNLVGTALAAVGKAETILLKKQDKDDETLAVIGCLSDAGRLLAKVHHSESEARRSIILGFSLQSNLQPLLKEALLAAPLDCWLFGKDLSERLKAAKVLEKLVADLKVVKPRPVLQAKNLNSQGPFRQQKRSRYHQPHPRQSGQNKYRPQTQKEERGKKAFRRRSSKY